MIEGSGFVHLTNGSGSRKPKIYESDGSGSATLVTLFKRLTWVCLICSRFSLLFTVVRSYGCNFCIFLAKTGIIKNNFFLQNGLAYRRDNSIWFCWSRQLTSPPQFACFLLFRVQFPVACEYSIYSSSLGSLSLSSVTNNKGKPISKSCLLFLV